MQKLLANFCVPRVLRFQDPGIVKEKTTQMQKKDFSNTLEWLQAHFQKFKDYRIVDKSPKYKEEVEIEVTGIVGTNKR